MPKLTIIFLSIFLIVAAFSPVAVCKDLPLVDFVQEYGLFDTNKITVNKIVLISKLKPGEKIEIIDIDKLDVLPLLETLRRVSFEEGVYHKCLGDYNITFYSDKGKHIFNLGHRTMIHTEKGIYYLGNDFVEIMKKYLPQYFEFKETK